MGGRTLQIRIVASHAPAMQMSIVVPAIALTCIGVVLHPQKGPSSCPAMAFGFP